MVYNTTASLGKLTCTDSVDFGKCQDRFGRFSFSKNDSIYLDVKLKNFKKGDKEFRLVQNFTMGEADFNQFLRLRNHLLIEAENFAGEENRLQLCYQHCPKTWMNKSNWRTSWLT